MDTLLSLLTEHALLALVLALTISVGVMHEVRLLLQILTVGVRTLKRGLHEWSLLLRTGNGEGEVLVVDTENVESVRRLVRVLKTPDTVQPSTTDK